jgi:hypothetical protein
MKNFDLKELNVEVLKEREQKLIFGGFVPLAWGAYVVGCLAFGYMIGKDIG